MNAREVLCEMVRCGHTVDYDGETIVVRPKMNDALRARVLARKPELLAFLRELGKPPATAHAFVATVAADAERIRRYGVCLSCGCPWLLHGEPPIAAWHRIENASDAPLIQAAAIVATAVAACYVEL